ncbi:radical SAM family heme chaperone HemW [Fictibacillus barbaricus]|uniref:Heme chaperone HemW n=1 Tax=Fictibacillus barbaricus TaxID=182136 RepID=A0ABS2ZHC2_9BACL|nr:radical SAM family heme chaperone HemW [Fictibacillus barbaricus]MBN3547578.1 oxygen-independent coproporphyrinogen III oxidase [Fictibacillus barbaricus]GGB49989.1 oxygen-independent coproporphyrinogen-III oxidase-like protein YqeR [Fictibacillus barbaricus]
MLKAAYLHIPFCVQICHYCDFNKIFIHQQPVDEYLKSMKTEMLNTTNRFNNYKMETIFVGGGTPTSLSESQLDTFLRDVNEVLGNQSLKEFTVEANPEQTTNEKIAVLKSNGVNRLSIGVQAFQDSLLKKIGRTHNKEDVYSTVFSAKKAGIHNMSIDLMFGLPGQTMEMFKESVNEALALDVPHISSYSLQIEKKTVFYNLAQKGKLVLPEQELEAAMYEYLIETLDKRGFKQYEISNFAVPGFESKHNLQYWDNNEYFGIGAGAHSYAEGTRRRNAGPLRQYMSLIEENGFPYVEEHLVPLSEKMEEEMFMGLRKHQGVSDKTFFDRYGKSMFDVYKDPIERLIQKGWLERKKDTLMLTKEGIPLGNEVFQEFIGVVLD